MNSCTLRGSELSWGILFFFSELSRDVLSNGHFTFWHCTLSAAYVKVHSNSCFATWTKALFWITEVFRSHVTVERELSSNCCFATARATLLVVV